MKLFTKSRILGAPRLISVAAGSFVVAGIAVNPVWAMPPDGPSDTTDVIKVEFCHATRAEKNPYTHNSTSVSAFYNAGHIDHGGDIWRAFSYVKQGKTITVPAQNLGAIGSTGVTGEQILAAGCEIPAVAPTVPPTTPPPTVPPTTQPPTTQPPTTQPPTTQPPTTQPPTTQPPTTQPPTSKVTPIVPPSATTTPATTPAPPSATPPVSPSAAIPPTQAATTKVSTPSEMRLSAETAAGDPGPNYALSMALMGTGGVMFAWAGLASFKGRRRGQHS